MKAPVIIAHRTSPAYAPENSLEGIGVSFEQGADGVEIDLRMSLDLRSFLMHDNSMWRTTGWPLPIELTPSSVVGQRRLRTGSGVYGAQPHPRALFSRGEGGVPDEAVSGATTLRDESGSYGLLVPTLEEAIEAVPADKLFAVDVKTPWSIFDLVRVVRRREMESRTLVWCSSALVVRYAASKMPGVEVAYYKDFEDGPNNIEFVGKAARIGAQAVSLDWRGISPEVVSAAHWLGLKVYSWHKEHPITREKIESGLDGLITDYPARSRELIAAM